MIVPKSAVTMLWAVLSAICARTAAQTCASAAQNASVFAVEYSYPIQAFQQLATPLLARVGANQLYPGRQLSGPADQTVVRPNADTLYTTMIIDLSQSDLVLTVPAISDRFWVFPFYDFYGNNFASISITNNDPAGNYLIRRADDALVEPGITYTKNSNNYKGHVNFPTSYGVLLGRILVLQNNTADLTKIHAYQDATIVTTVTRKSSKLQALQTPALTPALLNSTSSNAILSNLNIVAKLGVYNQPEVLSDRYTTASILGQAGLSNGQYCTPAGVNLTQAVATANTNMLIALGSRMQSLGNGWSIEPSAYSGDFGTNYAVRAYIALVGYLQLVQSQAVYPSGTNNTLTLAPGKALLFTFSKKPPVKSVGFWSLTVYNGALFLIPNSLNRYEIGDRTAGLKYENGGLVNGNGTDHDGPFQVLLQQADLPPPSNWTNNWLPAPAGGGTISYTLRFYAASAALTNGKYVYPVVQQINAITA